MLLATIVNCVMSKTLLKQIVNNEKNCTCKMKLENGSRRKVV